MYVMNLTLIILYTLGNSAFHHPGIISVACYAPDSPSSDGSEWAFEVLEIIGNGCCSTIIDSNWDQVGIEDRPTRMRVGCNTGCTYKHMYDAGEPAEIDLLAGSAMRMAALEYIVSCLLAFASRLGMKTGYWQSG